MTTTTQTFGQLAPGSVINYYRGVTADNTNYAVLRQYEDRFGSWTEVLNLETFDKDCFSSNTEFTNFWTIVKEN